MLLIIRKKKPGLKFNPGLALTRVWTTGPRSLIQIYYINTNEIPSAFARKLDIFTCEISLLLWLHDKLHLSHQKNYESEMVWYFIGVYIINRTLHGCLEIWNFSSQVEKNISLVRCAHLWNVFEHSRRNFVSPCGHVMSSIRVRNWVYVQLPLGQPQDLVLLPIEYFGCPSSCPSSSQETNTGS